MPGNRYASIQNPPMYRRLRQRGFSKTAAARISNARTPGHRVKDTSLAIPPTGAQALFSTPGASLPRWRKRRTKAGPNWGARAGQTIVGGLARGSDGRFASSGAPSARGAQSARGAERRAARQSRADARARAREEALRQEDATRAEEDAYINAGKTGRERQARRREVAQKRRERAAQRREAARQAQEQERVQRQQEDAAEAEARAAEKPKGGGGGGKPKPSDEQRQAEQAKKRAETAARTAQQTSGAARITLAEVDALRRAATGGQVSEAEVDGLVERGLILVTGNDAFEASDQGRAALSALERGNLSSYQAALQNARNRLSREASARERQAAQAQRAQERARAAEARRAATEQRRRDAEARRAARDAERRAQQAERNRIADLRARRGVTVVKDAQGRDRWVAVSSTAYRDRDGEIVSVEALKAAVARADQGGGRGPLRFWHVPGLDLGDCDFQMVGGPGDRYLIESGTFRKPAYAAALKAAGALQMSIGFVHPADQPGPDGVFSDIAIFERSVVPDGRAANPMTRLTLKERRMSDEKLKAAEQLLGKDLLTELLAQTAKDDASAQAAGVAYKDAQIAELKDQIASLAATVKALTDKAPMPAAEMVEAGETELDDGLAEEDPADVAETVAEYIGDMAPADFEAMLERVFARAVAGMGADIAAKMAAMDEQLKGMGYSRMKEAAAEALGGVHTQVQALAADVATLKGEQPRAARTLAGGVLDGLSALTVTPAQAAQIVAQTQALKEQAPTPSGTVPPGLTPQEADAHRMLWGE